MLRMVLPILLEILQKKQTFKAKKSDDGKKEEGVNRLRKKNASMWIAHPTLSSSEKLKGNVWSFCHPDLNTKQLDGSVGQQEDTVVPLRVKHPNPAHQSPRSVRLGLLFGNST